MLGVTMLGVCDLHGIAAIVDRNTCLQTTHRNTCCCSRSTQTNSLAFYKRGGVAPAPGVECPAKPPRPRVSATGAFTWRTDTYWYRRGERYYKVGVASSLLLYR